MGIDVYLSWPKQTKAQAKKQVTGFSTRSGHVGYLREAYHGGPYVTRFLVAEAFAAECCEALIPAATLRERLPVAVMLSIYREHVVYGERADHPGEIEVGKGEGGVALLTRALSGAFTEIAEAKAGTALAEIVARITPAQIEQAKAYIASGKLEPTHKAFVDFVALAEQQEKACGVPCKVYASY